MDGDVGEAEVSAARAQNDRVRAALAEHGDDGTAARRVRHHIAPQEAWLCPADAGMLGSAFGEIGFDVAPGQADLPSGLAGLMLIEEGEVAGDDFDLFNARLIRDVTALGWLYMGWDCEVKTGRGLTG